MNLDELKTAWRDYDRKLQSTQLINERIITSMITERSRSTWGQARRYYIFGFVSTSFWFLLGIAVLIGNPFDYQDIIQYTPIAVMSLCFLAFLILFIINYRKLDSINIHHDNLDASLKKIIKLYEKPRKLLTGVLYIYLVAAFAFPISFLSQKIARTGVWEAILDTLIPMAISAALLLIASKLGAFKERHKLKFEKNLNELQELKALSAELLC
ncbi:MAG: hypothetical protein C0490_01085 [Marivirga sp.]|nr:hypothetical protein [Marivirga sp.]